MMPSVEIKPAELLLDEIHRYVRRRVPADQVDDVTQDIMLRIVSRQGRVRDSERIGAWVHRVAHNAVVDVYRRRPALDTPVDETHLERAAGFGAEASEEDESDARRRLAACVRPMIEQLEPHYAEALRLTELEGLNQREAAARCGISWSGMKSRVQRARARLVKALHDCCEFQCDARGKVIAYHRKR